MTTREQTIATLERNKAELAADLRAASPAALDSEWGRDRVAELAWVNRQLVRMGAAPAGIVLA